MKSLRKLEALTHGGQYAYKWIGKCKHFPENATRWLTQSFQLKPINKCCFFIESFTRTLATRFQQDPTELWHWTQRTIHTWVICLHFRTRETSQRAFSNSWKTQTFQRILEKLFPWKILIKWKNFHSVIFFSLCKLSIFAFMSHFSGHNFRQRIAKN